MANLKQIWNNAFTKKINQAFYQYWISSGVANTIPNSFDSYIENGYAANADVYSIITRIDAMRKQAKLVLKKKLPDGKTEVVEDHELLKFTQKVNPNLSTDEMFTQYFIYYLCLGNFFVYYPKPKAGLNAGKTDALYPMPVNEVEIIEGNWMNPVSGYKMENSINPIFEKSEVYHAKMYNPMFMDEQSLYGMAPLRAAAKIVSKQNESQETQLKQFENQGAPFALFRKNGAGNNGIQSRLSDPQQKQITKQIKNAGKGENRGLPTILKDEYGILNFGNTIADLNIIESSKDGRKVLAGIWTLPPILMGVDDPTYNNMREARKAAWTDCIMPNLDKLKSLMNETTIYCFEPYVKEGLFWDFDLSEVQELQEDLKTKVEWMRLARWSANDILEATGKQPKDNELMNEPIFSNQDVFLSDLSIDEETKNFIDYEDGK